ncbi:hypothetical protein PR048_012694, partial [Dryococelus australis]
MMWDKSKAGRGGEKMTSTILKWADSVITTLVCFFKGHTRMEADTIHALIERKRKEMNDMTILTLWDWQQMVRQCSSSYHVHNMEQEDSKQFTSLFSGRSAPFINRKTSVEKEKSPVPIVEQKFNDLISLLPYVPSVCNALYKNLKKSSVNNRYYPESAE